MNFVMILSQFNIRINSPTSTSKTRVVAQKFAGDGGLLIELNNNGDKYDRNTILRCFPCDWASTYSGEDEYLFAGGQYKIKVESVKIMGKDNNNYKSYCRALFILIV